MRTIINTAKEVLEKGKWYVYHKEQNATARKYLKYIEAEKGKLDSKSAKLCKEYAKDVFGNEKYAQWLIVYSTYARGFKEGFIPDNYYGEIVLPQLNGEYGKICNRKAVLNNLLDKSETLDICYYTNKLFLDINYNILNEGELKKSLFTDNEKVVFKLEESRQGMGIFIFNEKNFDLNFIRKSGNGVFQRFVEQHSFFSEFSEPAVATVRITSIIDNEGKPQIRAGFFKFGSKDDSYLKSDTATYIPFDIKTGKLTDEAYACSWQLIKKLPGLNSFAGKELPSFNNCLEKVKKIHKQIPFVRCTGWDLIVDKHNDIKILEVNGGHNGITLNETTQGPCFKGLGWEDLRKTK